MKNAYLLTLDGVEIPVERRRIRNMYLRVQPDGRVLLTAPKLAPDFLIERFARARLPWLIKHLHAAAPEPSLRFESGDPVMIWGEPHPLALVFAGKQSRVERNNGIVHLRVPEGATAEDRKRALDHWYRKELAEAIEQLAPACEQIVGKHASVWRIRDMKTRWGTCNTQSAAITINLQLIHRAPGYLRYVMLHELTHLHEPSHNTRFYALMDRFCPDWKRIRKALKQGA